jgi:hypothetical protein
MQIAFARKHTRQEVIRQIILTPENDEDADLLEELELYRDYRIRLVKGKVFKTREEEERERESLFIVLARFKHPTEVSRRFELSRLVDPYY